MVLYQGSQRRILSNPALTDNPNPPNKNGRTPLHVAAIKGRDEIVRILAPLLENVNIQDSDGCTPIYLATSQDNNAIVRILAPLTNNPNVPNKK